MDEPPPSPPPPGVVEEILDLMASWLRDLRTDCSPLTLKTYRESIQIFAGWIGGLDEPPESIDEIDRDHVRDWLAHLKEAGRADSTIGTRFRNVRTFFNWLVAEQELAAAPTAGVREPKVIDNPVPVVRVDLLRQMLDTCDRSFEGRRDEALLRSYVDGGMRLAECATLALADADMDQQVFWVLGKGGRRRAVPFTDKTARALDRYLRGRRRHPKAGESKALWLGRKGPLTPDGVYQMIVRRAERAGVGHIHPHQLRHTAAHELSMAGMSDRDMRRIFGWGPKSRMPDRYGASAADEHAREAHRRLSFGDQL